MKRGGATVRNLSLYFVVSISWGGFPMTIGITIFAIPMNITARNNMNMLPMI